MLTDIEIADFLAELQENQDSLDGDIRNLLSFDETHTDAIEELFRRSGILMLMVKYLFKKLNYGTATKDFTEFLNNARITKEL